jgi:hypothetical protein
MAYGDHLKVQRFIYTHHGIDCGDGSVIEFAPKRSVGMVRRVSMSDFAEGGQVEVVEHPDRAYSRNMIVWRAKRRIGEMGWSLLRNNCEHFATWCVTGSVESQQVQQGLVFSVLGLAIGLLLTRG